MKRRIALLMVGVMVGLTACGTQQAATETVDQTTETVETTETAQEQTENTAETEQGEYVEDTVLSTDLFTVTIPDEFKGKFLAQINGDEIYVYDKASNEAGFNGFVFSVVADRNKDYVAGGMYTKVGEIASPDAYCDVLKSGPSDVQWDYTVSEEMPEDYAKLYNAVDDIIANIQGNNGATYMHGAGMKGEDLYFSTVVNFSEACSEGWDAAKFEEEGMSPEYGALIKNEGEKALDKIGYAYMDITNDGVDELLIGIIEDGNEPSVVYDIYTTIDKETKHVISGTSRNRCYALEYGGFANVTSGGANENEVALYEIEPGSTDLMQQYSLKYDGYEDEKNPWFVSYDDGVTWESMTEEDYNDRLKMTEERYLKLDYKPISDIIPIDYSKVDLTKYGTFTEMISDFKPGMGYANIKLGDTDVFLVSSGTYNWDGKDNAIDSSIFMYDDKGGIVLIGQVASIGTAYPLMTADGCLFAGGHHEVFKYTVKDGKLVIAEEAEEVFDTAGNATYYYTNDPTKNEEVPDDSNLTRLFDEYFGGEVVEFSTVQ